jgi:hypothetical protein
MQGTSPVGIGFQFSTEQPARSPPPDEITGASGPVGVGGRDSGPTGARARKLGKPPTHRWWWWTRGERGQVGVEGARRFPGGTPPVARARASLLITSRRPALFPGRGEIWEGLHSLPVRRRPRAGRARH